MSFRRAPSGWLVSLGAGVLWLLFAGGWAGGAEGVISSGTLHFLDGSTLRGELRGIEPGQVLRWQHPQVEKPILLEPTHLDFMRFRPAGPSAYRTAAPNRFRFANGDEILGTLVSLDEKTVVLEWKHGKGGRIIAPRAQLRGVNFLESGSMVLYDGPTGIEGWVTAGGPNGWRYRDGAFFATGVGTLGRDVKLGGSTRIEFDVEWSGSLNLIVTLFTSVIERMDYSTSSYMFYLNPTSVTAQRVQARAGTRNLGQVMLPDLAPAPGTKTRFEIRVNKELSVWSMLLNGVLLHEWTDPEGFGAGGTGIRFDSQRAERIELSNLRISEWDWQSEAGIDRENAAEEDVVFLANRDRVSGRIGSIGDGKVILRSGQSDLQIPMDRVTHVQFAGGAAPRTLDPWLVRAQLLSGEQISIEIEGWDSGQISGQTRNFGAVALSPDLIRVLQFNPYRPRSAPSVRMYGNDPLDIFE